MNKFKALIVLLLVSLGAWVGITNYMAPEASIAQPENKAVQEETFVDAMGALPETPRKLTIFPYGGGLFSGLLTNKLNFLNIFTGGLFGGYYPRAAPVVQETKIVNTVNVVNVPTRSLNGRYALNFPQISF